MQSAKENKRKSLSPILDWVIAFAIVFALSVNGCAHETRTVYVPNGEPVKIRATVKGAAVWVADPSGKWIEGTMDLPEGWYCLPDTEGESK